MKTITVKELKKVLNQTLAEERLLEAFREDVTRNLGPIVITDVKLERLAENVNDRIDVLERTGRASALNFKHSILLKLSEHKDAEVRRLAARLLPEKFVNPLLFDKDSFVRHAAAKNASIRLVRESLRRNPSDDELRMILRERSENLSIGERLKGVVKNPAAPELSDFAYHNLAKTAIRDYNQNMEGMWDEPWAARYCASMKATSGIDYDAKRLWEEIQKILSEKDDMTLERSSLKEAARNLYEQNESMFGYIHEEVDVLDDLLESNLSEREYVNTANKLFKIRESIMPAGLRKYRMSEGIFSDITIPCTGKLPHSVKNSVRAEQALDTYVNSWNSIQARKGEPIKINWSHNPMSIGSFSFNVELK
jgi:hypothetical protein